MIIYKNALIKLKKTQSQGKSCFVWARQIFDAQNSYLNQECDLTMFIIKSLFNKSTPKWLLPMILSFQQRTIYNKQNHWNPLDETKHEFHVSIATMVWLITSWLRTFDGLNNFTLPN